MLRHYINIKHNTIYEVLDSECISASNATDGDITVLYTDGKKKYTRDYTEFNEKFAPLNHFTRKDLETIAYKMSNDSLGEKLAILLKNNPSMTSMGMCPHYDEFDLIRIKEILGDDPISTRIAMFIEISRKPEIVTSKNYIDKALRTEPKNLDEIAKRISNHHTIRLMHSVMGLTTEIGELMDNIKRHLFYGEELDILNLKEESGDVMWYMALLIDILRTDMDDIMAMNIQKLKTRYPQKFNEFDALNRDTEKETNHIN